MSSLDQIWLNFKRGDRSQIYDLNLANRYQFEGTGGATIVNSDWQNSSLCETFSLGFLTLCLQADELNIQTHSSNRKKQKFRTKNNKAIARELKAHLNSFLKVELKHIPSTTVWVLERHFDGIPHTHALVFYPIEFDKEVKQKAVEIFGEKAMGEVANLSYLWKKTSKYEEQRYETAKVSGVQSSKDPKFITNIPKNTPTWAKIANVVKRFISESFKGYSIKNKRQKRHSNHLNKGFKVQNNNLHLKPADNKKRLLPVKIKVEKIDVQIPYGNSKQRYHHTLKLARKMTQK